MAMYCEPSSVKREFLLDEYRHPSESEKFLLRMKSRLSYCRRLKDICLFTIVKNFDIIIKQYDKKEKCHALPFKYLRQFQSQLLFEALLSHHGWYTPMKKSYILFLVNEHIKQLNLFRFNFGWKTFPALFKALKLCGHTILCLNLQEKDLTKDMIELFSFVPNLEAIYLDGAIFENNVFEIIGRKCPYLKTISLYSTDIKDGILKGFCKFSKKKFLEPNFHIQNLEMGGSPISESSIQFALRYFPSLKVLGSNLTDRALSLLHTHDLIGNNLNQCPKYALQEVTIDGNLFVDVHAVNVLRICKVLCPNTTSITLRSIKSDAQLNSCASYNCLKNLTLSFSDQLDSEILTKFLDLQKDHLEDLCINHAQINIVSIYQCRNIQKLELMHPVFDTFDESLQPSLHIFPHLIKVKLGGVYFSDYNTLKCICFILSCSPILSTLSLQAVSGLEGPVIESLLKCHFTTTLREFYLTSVTIPSSELEKFKRSSPCLEILDFFSCNVCD